MKDPHQALVGDRLEDYIHGEWLDGRTDSFPNVASLEINGPVIADSENAADVLRGVVS